MGNTVTTEDIFAFDPKKTTDDSPLVLDMGNLPTDVIALQKMYAEQKVENTDAKSSEEMKKKKNLSGKDIELQKHTNGKLETCEEEDGKGIFKVPQRPDEWLAERKKKKNSRVIITPMSSGQILKKTNKSSPSSTKVDVYCYEELEDESDEDELDDIIDDHDNDTDILDMSYGMLISITNIM